MFCKWCGEALKAEDTKCKRCGRDIPPLSDCGGFYDLIPKANIAVAADKDQKQQPDPRTVNSANTGNAVPPVPQNTPARLDGKAKPPVKKKKSKLFAVLFAISSFLLVLSIALNIVLLCCDDKNYGSGEESIASDVSGNDLDWSDDDLEDSKDVSEPISDINDASNDSKEDNAATGDTSKDNGNTSKDNGDTDVPPSEDESSEEETSEETSGEPDTDESSDQNTAADGSDGDADDVNSEDSEDEDTIPEDETPQATEMNGNNN